MASKELTALQIVTLANEGMFESWDTSSNMLIAFAALTPRLNESSCITVTDSCTTFLIFLGVVMLSTMGCRVLMAAWRFSSFCFFFLVLKLIHKSKSSKDIINLVVTSRFKDLL